MQSKEIQLATNETIIEMMKTYKHICKKQRHITYVTLSAIIIQNILFVLSRAL